MVENKIVEKLESFSAENEQKKFAIIDKISKLTQKLWSITAEEKYERPEHIKGNTEFNIWLQPIDWLETELQKLDEKIKEKGRIETLTKGMYEIKDLWDLAFGNDIFEQPAYSDFYFHGAIGTIFFHDFKIARRLDLLGIETCDEDIRAHMVLIGPTGVGKSQANDFTASIVSKIPKRIYETATGEQIIEYFNVSGIGKTTDAGYVGTLDSNTLNENIKSKTKQFITNKKGEKIKNPKWQNPLQPGLFSTTDLMIVDEAEQIFKANKDSSEVQILLRKTMNRYGSSNNILSNDAAKCQGLVKYPSSTTLMMTSYPIIEFNQEFAEGGLMQRTFIYIDYEDWDKRKRISRKFADSMVNDYDEKELEERRKKHEEIMKKYGSEKGIKQLLIEKIIELKKKTMLYKKSWKAEDRKEYVISHEVSNKIREYCIKLVESPMTISQQEKQQSQLIRLQLLFTRVTGHYAIIDGNFDNKGRPVLRLLDVEKAYQSIMINQSDSVSDFLKETMKENNEDKIFETRCKDVRFFLKGNIDDVTKTQLDLSMKKKWNISMSKTMSILKQVEQRGVFILETGSKGNTKICILKGKDPPSWIKDK